MDLVENILGVHMILQRFHKFWVIPGCLNDQHKYRRWTTVFLLVEIDFRRAWIEIQFFTFVDGVFHVRRWIVEPKPKRRRQPRAQMPSFPRYDLDSGIVLTHRETHLELFFYLLRLIKEQHFRCHVHLLDDGLSVWWLSVPQQAIWFLIWRSQWPGMDHQPLTSLGKWWVGTSLWHDVKWGILNLPSRRHFTKRFQLVFPPSPCWTHEKYIHQIFSNCKPCKP